MGTRISNEQDEIHSYDICGYQKRLIHADSAVHLSFITALQCFKQMFKVDDELGFVSILIQDS